MSQSNRRRPALGHPGGARPLQHPPLGREVFRHQRSGPRRRQAVAGGRRGGGPDGRHRGGQGARTEISGADSLSGHSAAPRRVASTWRFAIPSRNTITRANIAACFRSRSTSFARWWRKSSTRASRYDFGLEVGSKPELFAGLALQNQMGSLIICNGYKDCRFHPDGAARHQARQESHHGRREAGGAPPDHHASPSSSASSRSSASARGC